MRLHWSIPKRKQGSGRESWKASDMSVLRNELHSSKRSRDSWLLLAQPEVAAAVPTFLKLLSVAGANGSWMNLRRNVEPISRRKLVYCKPSRARAL
jgi:hypothetical protein